MSTGNPAMLPAIRQTIYNLNNRYGVEISVYRLASAATNYKTGDKSATKTSYDIRKAAVLPAEEMRKFFASISFISASKSFISPGQQGWDQSQRGFLIDARDIPGVELQPEDWIVYLNRRYELETIVKLDYNLGWLIVGKELKGSDPEQIINLNVVDTLLVDQEAIES
jgi:hypothetical protein